MSCAGAGFGLGVLVVVSPVAHALADAASRAVFDVLLVAMSASFRV
ncbi:MAG: hypothetical protein AAF495_04795 [Pseudomonadota bacterium]